MLGGDVGKSTIFLFLPEQICVGKTSRVEKNQAQEIICPASCQLSPKYLEYE